MHELSSFAVFVPCRGGRGVGTDATLVPPERERGPQSVAGLSSRFGLAYAVCSRRGTRCRIRGPDRWRARRNDRSRYSYKTMRVLCRL